MPYNYGPPVVDFSPLSKLADTFYNAQDNALVRQLKQQQLASPNEIAGIYANAQGQGSGIPQGSGVQTGTNPLSNLANPQAMKPPSFSGDNSRTMTMPADPSLAPAIKKYASAAGLDPVDVATAMSYETGGTFDPWKAGPTTQWGQHRGLIQWGEPQRQAYGVSADMPVEQQVAAAVKYLQDRGVKPGMGLMDIYSAINAGSVGRNNASDANNGGAPGTVADKVNNQMAGHRQKAMALLGVSPSDTPAPGAQETQFQIPGSGQSVPAGQPAQAGVTAPRIPVPAYVQQMLASPNYYTKMQGVQLLQKYQELQQQLDVKVWEKNLDFGHDDQKQTREFDYHRPFDEAKAGAAQTSAAAAQTNALTNQGKLKETIAQNSAGNALRDREVKVQEGNADLAKRTEDFNEGQKIKGPVNDRITEVLNTGRSQAMGAADTLKDLARQEADLNAGMFTGAGADAKQAAAQYLTRILPGVNDAVSAGQDYQAAVQREVGSLARQLAQTGHTTNMDINVGKMISAADPTYTEQAIRQIIQANRQRALDTIQRQNNTVDQASKSNSGAKDQYEFFRVQPPEEANGPPAPKGVVGGTSPSGIKWKLK